MATSRFRAQVIKNLRVRNLLRPNGRNPDDPNDFSLDPLTVERVLNTWMPVRPDGPDRRLGPPTQTALAQITANVHFVAGVLAESVDPADRQRSARIAASSVKMYLQNLEVFLQ